MTVDYAFGDGATLQATRDPSIEYSTQEATFVTPASEDPIALLTRTEHAAFGKDGCGIDWQRGANEPAANDAKGTDQVFRGSVCNCQGRVRRDAAGKVVGLSLRSTC